MPRRIAVAVSGGVDSLVAARLLQRAGENVFAIHFINGFESPAAGAADPNGAIAALRRMTDGLGIPLTVVDLSGVFHRTVAAYLIDTYRAGRTPNPCMVCNPTIKLGHLWQAAREKGAEALATGHYAIIAPDADGRAGLYRGADRGKDQSYFLARATAEQLARTVFPLGRLSKSAVRSMAAAQGLTPAVTSESQDICFLNGGSYAAFMTRHGDGDQRPGPIRDVSGRRVGTHTGLHQFTVGQRRGINVPAAAPYYVVRIDAAENCLIVGSKADLDTQGCRAVDINWLVPAPAAAFAATVKVRYRSPEVAAVITPTGPAEAAVRFHTPVAAVTPGQGAVFYSGERVLGGGWIAEPLPAGAADAALP